MKKMTRVMYYPRTVLMVRLLSRSPVILKSSLLKRNLLVTLKSMVMASSKISLVIHLNGALRSSMQVMMALRRIILNPFHWCCNISSQRISREMEPRTMRLNQPLRFPQELHPVPADDKPGVLNKVLSGHSSQWTNWWERESWEILT